MALVLGFRVRDLGALGKGFGFKGRFCRVGPHPWTLKSLALAEPFGSMLRSAETSRDEVS